MRRTLAALLAVMVTAVPVTGKAAETDPYAGQTAAAEELKETATAETLAGVGEEAVSAGTTAGAADIAEEGVTEEPAAVEGTVSETAAAEDTTEESGEPAEETAAAGTTEESGESAEETAAAGATEGSGEIADEEEPMETADGENGAAEGAAEESAAAGETAVIEEPIVEEASPETKKAAREGEYFWTDSNTGKKYLFINGVKSVTNSWYTHPNGNTYYIGADGAVVTGFKKIDGKTYFFWDSRCQKRNALGVMVTGWQTINKRKFYFAEDGGILTGWRKIDGKMYFFANSLFPSLTPGTMLTGFRTIEKRNYYFGTDGARRTGFHKIDGKTYYFVDQEYSAYTAAKEGIMLKDSKKIGDKYYFFSQYGYVRTGWVKVGKLAAFFNEDGTAATGWKQKGSNWFYLKETGIAQTGWLKLGSDSIYYFKGASAGRMLNEPTVMSNEKLYFFGADGRRATSTGWKNYGKYYYYTYSNGTCAVSTKIDGIWLDENGRTEMTKMDIKAQGYYSNTNYLILVDRSIHKVGIYKGRQGNWVNIKRYSCGDGKASTPTIEGTFSVGIKLWYFDSGSARCWYATQFSGNYLFHSVLYYQDSYPAEVMDGTLGAGVSHGCVRLAVSNARWIYDNIPGGTKVVVYH